MKQSLIIGIDFDGTCVRHEYPGVGGDIGASPVLLRLVKNGHRLILWTMRHEKELNDAVEWFRSKDIPLWGINTNPDQHEWTSSPKAHCHLLIDDVALGVPLVHLPNERPFVCWDEVEKWLENRGILPSTVSA